MPLQMPFRQHGNKIDLVVFIWQTQPQKRCLSPNCGGLPQQCHPYPQPMPGPLFRATPPRRRAHKTGRPAFWRRHRFRFRSFLRAGRPLNPDVRAIPQHAPGRRPSPLGSNQGQPDRADPWPAEGQMGPGSHDFTGDFPVHPAAGLCHSGVALCPDSGLYRPAPEPSGHLRLQQGLDASR